jgi:methionyl aminopeptidase
VTIGSASDIAGLERIGRIVALTLAAMRQAARPGMTTAELDAIGRDGLQRHGARSAPRLDYDFPGDTCISVNEEVAHGIPGTRVLAPGDVVNVDVSAELDGYYADTGATFVLPPAPPRVPALLRATRAALAAALATARAGTSLADIGRAIEATATGAGFHVIRNLASHGTGRRLHEEPSHILSFHDAGETRRLQEGQVITLEPFLATHARSTRKAADGWTLCTPHHNRSAQYEHTLIVTRGAPHVVTAGGFV